MRGPIITFKRARRLRREMSLPEVVLWGAVRRGRLRMRFRRQHPVGPYVLDFYCPETRLAVEVDGAVHDLPERALRDERRDAWLAEQGIRVLRFSAAQVLDDRELEGVLALIQAVGRGEA
ncbi:MAG: endonuclease domain-containing protein [Devosia sp.]